MTNIDKLHEIEKLRFRISKQMELISYYETMSHSLGGADFTCERVDKTRNLNAPFVKWIYKKIDAESELQKMEQELQEKIDEMSNIVESIDNIDYRRILTYRYLLNQDWESISTSLHLSLSSIHRYHRKSLDELSTIKS